MTARAEHDSMTSMRNRDRISKILLYSLLLIGAVMALLPMVWMVSASLMPSGEASSFPPRFFPSRVTFDHYLDLFTRLNLGRYLLNSAFVSIVVTLSSLAINALAGYAFAKLRFRGRDRLFKSLSITGE